MERHLRVASLGVALGDLIVVPGAGSADDGLLLVVELLDDGSALHDGARTFRMVVLNNGRRDLLTDRDLVPEGTVVVRKE